MTVDPDSPVAAGMGLVENILRDIVFVSELQRDAVQRKSGFSNSASEVTKIEDSITLSCGPSSLNPGATSRAGESPLRDPQIRHVPRVRAASASARETG